MSNVQADMTLAERQEAIRELLQNLPEHVPKKQHVFGRIADGSSSYIDENGGMPQLADGGACFDGILEEDDDSSESSESSDGIVGGIACGDDRPYISSGGAEGGIACGDDIPYMSSGGAEGGIACGDDIPYMSSGGAEGGIACGDDRPYMSSGGAEGGIACGDDRPYMSSGGAEGGIACGYDRPYMSSGGAEGGIACGDDRPWFEADSDGIACGDDTPMFPDPNDTTTGASSKKDSGVFSSQFDSSTIELESKILRFVADYTSNEYRFPGTVSQIQHTAIKKFAAEHGLIHKILGKGHGKVIALRKKQKDFETRQMVEQIKLNQRRFAEMKKKAEYSVDSVSTPAAGGSGLDTGVHESGVGCMATDTPGSIVSGGCEGIACGDDEPLFQMPTESSVLEKPVKVDSSMNTAAEGFFVCVYCEGDVPESIRSLHTEHCQAEYKQKLKTRQKALLEEAERLEVAAAREKKNRKKRRQRKEEITKIREAEQKLVVEIEDWQRANSLLQPSKKGKNAEKTSAKKSEKTPSALEKVHANDFEHLLTAAKKEQHISKNITKNGVNGNMPECQKENTERSQQLRKNLKERLAYYSDRRK